MGFGDLGITGFVEVQGLISFRVEDLSGCRGLEGQTVIELESWRAGELEGWRAGELESCRAGELELFVQRV